MFYLTGDIHGNIKDVLKFINWHHLTPEDTVIILGDVGLNYYGNNDHGERRKKQKLQDTGVTIFCIHGNHERRPATLPSYHETTWHGGTVYVEDDFPNLLFAKDGEIFDLDGLQAIALGGAYSVDKYYRIRMGFLWFLDEQPSEEIKQYVEVTLNELDWKVDVVLSHTCPAKYTPVEAFLPELDQSTVDTSTEEWLDRIEDRLDYRRWYCGHWHIDKHIDNLHFLMNDFELLEVPQNES